MKPSYWPVYVYNLHLKRGMTVEEQEVFVVLCSVSGAMSVCVWVYREKFCCFGPVCVKSL